ncbi:MAG: glutathione S-transferase family protein [Gammaproteobacteria bacterium]|nr:glutathione S-transferase family protein [Gammaproteobacteria bacterium]MBT6245998.1 glutathione S-transferase family protein [Gammaproteobacteria bacterium]
MTNRGQAMQLYHNAVSTCSQKVRMVIHEKGLMVEDHLIDLQKGEQFSEDYVRLNPNAVVPTLIDDNKVMIESTLINEYLDDAYPEKNLKPESEVERYLMRLICKKIDDSLHPACGIVTYSIGMRPGLLARPQAEVEAMVAKIPNPTRRATRRAVIDYGVAAPQFREAMLSFRALFDLAEALLEEREWLTGSTFSLADCALMPYVLRLDHLRQEDEINSRVNLSRWYEAIQQRQSYSKAVTQWAPAGAIAMLNKTGLATQAEIAAAMEN